MSFEACRACTDKRHPGCQDHCRGYLDEKAARDARLSQILRQKAIDRGIYEQKNRGVHRALRRRKSK